MKKKYIIFTFILFGCFIQSQIKLDDKVIDSIIMKNSSKCFDFHLDKKNSYASFEELTKDESLVPKKLKIPLSDVSNLNKVLNNGKEYDYLVIYNYKFTINDSVFSNKFFRYSTSQYDKSAIKMQVDNVNFICSKIKKEKFISPKKAESIARRNGLENIEFQSIESLYYKPKNNHIQTVEKYVWIFKEKKNEKLRTLVINAKIGKVLTDYIQ